MIAASCTKNLDKTQFGEGDKTYLHNSVMTRYFVQIGVQCWMIGYREAQLLDFFILFFQGKNDDVKCLNAKVIDGPSLPWQVKELIMRLPAIVCYRTHRLRRS